MKRCKDCKGRKDCSVKDLPGKEYIKDIGKELQCFMPEPRRCKDCKWLLEFNFNSNVGFRCLSVQIPRFADVYTHCCSNYTRKWWKFWRPK